MMFYTWVLMQLHKALLKPQLHQGRCFFFSGRSTIIHPNINSSKLRSFLEQVPFSSLSLIDCYSYLDYMEKVGFTKLSSFRDLVCQIPEVFINLISHHLTMIFILPPLHRTSISEKKMTSSMVPFFLLQPHSQKFLFCDVNLFLISFSAFQVWNNPNR